VTQIEYLSRHPEVKNPEDLRSYGVNNFIILVTSVSGIFITLSD